MHDARHVGVGELNLPFDAKLEWHRANSTDSRM
jgi:hypothetical protein